MRRVNQFAKSGKRKYWKKVIEMKRPKTRYVITGQKLINYTLPSILPDRIFDKLFWFWGRKNGDKKIHSVFQGNDSSS